LHTARLSGLMVRDAASVTRLLSMRVKSSHNNDLIPRRREAPSRGMDKTIAR
jgi:hypothetical protein